MEKWNNDEPGDHRPHIPEFPLPSSLIFLVQLVDVSELPLVITSPEHRDAVIAPSNQAVLCGPNAGQVGKMPMLRRSQAAISEINALSVLR